MMLLLSAALLQPDPAWPAASDGWGAARGLTAAACVLGVMMLLAWLVRRGSLNFAFRRGGSAISVETAAALGDRRTLVIVSVEGRRLLLGVTSVQVSLLAELPPAAATFERSLDQSLGGSRPV